MSMDFASVKQVCLPSNFCAAALTRHFVCGMKIVFWLIAWQQSQYLLMPIIENQIYTIAQMLTTLCIVS